MENVTFRKGIIFIVLFFSGFFPLVGIAQPKDKKENSKALTKVETISISPKQLIKRSSYIGHIHPEDRVTLSSEISGIIEKAGFLEGDRVKKGQVLFEIDTSSLLVDLNLNKSNYELAQTNYKRELKLFKQKLTTSANLSGLKNQLDVNKYRLELSKINFEKSKVRSPLSGIILKKKAERGEYVNKGVQIAEVININNVLAVINIPEREIRFAENQKQVEASLDAMPEKSFVGKIKNIGLEADRSSRSFEVEVEIPNPQRLLLPGMLVRIKMTTVSLSDQIVVPRNSVQEDESGSYVFIVLDGKSQKKPITTGISVDEIIQVRSGLSYGDELIVTGQQLLTDDEPIEVTRRQSRIDDSEALSKLAEKK
ncbi:MAG: efflux RND transporter periplasmic adaptor subunit [Deltaproteobacteria bacterium]|nr:efflux RND transporter periplasmic adaptor subunit [Deltaproteobacteria bacterium]